MNLAARLVLFLWGAVLATSCGSGPPPKDEPSDTGAGGPVVTFDAGRNRDRTNGMLGGVDAARPESDPPDARRPRDSARDSGEPSTDAAEGDARGSDRGCSAGHTCTGNARCQRSCFGSLIYRCSCADGRFVCTGCMSVDGGLPDLRGGPAICGADVGAGRRCDTAGEVCQLPGDGPQRLCACGDFPSDRIWICQ